MKAIRRVVPSSNRKRRRTPLLAALAISAVGLGACSSSTNHSAGAAAGTAGGTTATTTATTSAAANLGSLTVVAPVAHTFFYLPSDLGLKLGTWQRLGLSVKNVVVQGAGQSAQLLASGSADIELGTGPTDVNAIERGLPAKIVGALGLSFRPFVLIVPANSSIKAAADIKGHTIGITGKGALTDYVVQQLAKHQGWSASAVKEAPLGGLSEQLAAMKAGSTDGFVWTAGAGYSLEAKGQGRIAFSFAPYVPTQVFENLTASDALIQKRSAALQAYVTGWYQVANYMKAHPAETIAFVASSYGVPTSVATQIYNYEMPGLSLDGAIPPANLTGLLNSAVNQGAAKSAPSASTIFDGSFLKASA